MNLPKTLLYLASGEYKPIYEKLPFDRVILVDYHFGNQQLPFPSKVRLMGVDALMAIRQLRAEGVKIHAFVSLNEGLDEGNGHYPIISDALLGYLSPILSDEVVLVLYPKTNLPGASGNRAWNFGFRVEKLLPDHPYYLEPTDFSYSREEGQHGAVYLLRRNYSVTPIPNQLNLKLNLIHGSIWQDEDQLDLIGMNLRPRTSKKQQQLITDFFLGHERVMNIHGKSFAEIIELAEAQGIERLGLTPWKKGDYKEVIDYLQNHRLKNVRLINFYHLNKRDYKELYQLRLRQVRIYQQMDKTLETNTTPFCISFGRSKEWNFWFSNTRKNLPDHFQNFKVSAKAVELRLSKSKSRLDDILILEEIVQELIKSHDYFPVTFPAMTLTLTESSKPKTILEEFTAFPVISADREIESRGLLLYSRDMYWDKFRLDLFPNTPQLRKAITALSAQELSKNPDLSPLDLHELILSELANTRIKPVSFDHLAFHDPTRSGEGLSPFWEEWLSPEFLSARLDASQGQREQQGSPF